MGVLLKDIEQSYLWVFRMVGVVSGSSERIVNARKIYVPSKRNAVSLVCQINYSNGMLLS